MVTSRKLSTAIGIILIIIVIVSVSLVIVFFGNPLNNDNSQNNQSNDIVQITKESDFTEKYHFPGNGTISSPYIIENLSITNQPEIAIGIYNVKCIFVIRSCNIIAVRCCIYLRNVYSNGSSIIGNKCKIDPRGTWYPEEGIAIEVCLSSGITIRNNYCHSITHENAGIMLYKTSFSFVIDNTCTFFKYGICNTFISGGVGVWEFYNNINNTITGNYCFENSYGISSQCSGWLEVTNNYCSNNSNGMEITHSLSYDTQTTLIYNNTCVFNYRGLIARSLPKTDISDNNCSYNTDCGMSLYRCNGNITRNVCNSNEAGIQFSNQASYIYCNTIAYNIQYGLVAFFASGNEWVFSNNLINNNLLGTEFGFAQAFERCEDNPEGKVRWYNPLTHIGNYWSDLVWYEGVFYYIDNTFNTDIFPLEHPVNI